MTMHVFIANRCRCMALLLIAVAMLLGQATAQLAFSDAAAHQESGEVLRLYFWQAPTTLNPHLSAGTKDYNAARITYEPLATFDYDGVMVPVLAAEVPSIENGGVAANLTAVTWHLKPNLLWSDGEPFTADDVRFTYEYITNPDVASTSAASYAGIERVEVVNDLTVTIFFTEPTNAWATPFV